MKQCSSCVLSHQFPGIEFDEQGVCNYSRAFENFELKDRLQDRDLPTSAQSLSILNRALDMNCTKL